MKLEGIMIGSPKPKELAGFYEKILGKPVWDEGDDWKSFSVGTGSITIGPHSDVKGQNESPGRIMTMFTTKDVKPEFERIKKLGAKVVAEPYRPDESQDMWLATFADPDGNYFQIGTPWEEAP